MSNFDVNRSRYACLALAVIEQAIKDVGLHRGSCCRDARDFLIRRERIGQFLDMVGISWTMWQRSFKPKWRNPT